MNTISYYKKENGKIPVLEFLFSLDVSLRAKTYHEIELLEEYGFFLGGIYVKALNGKENRGLYELRIRFASDSVRIFYFCHQKNNFILLHGF